ncbi:hypothetical protein ACR6HW_14660 [Fusibacter sp. JL298sf-3]
MGIKTRDLTLIAILSAALTAGKMALFSIPNVEIVTFLLIVYTVVFGKTRTLLAAFVFVTTEVLLWGFGTWIIGYYFIWPLLIVMASLLSRVTRNEYAYAGLSAVFGFTFGLMFAIFESFFYGAAYGFTYWISGLPFDIVHGVSNFLIALFLFKPVVRTVEKVKPHM